MKVAILNDYQRAVPTLAAFSKLSGHEVEVFSDAERDEAKIAERLADFEAIILIRERTRFTTSLIARLPRLKLLVQTGKVGPHVDLEACRARGITVCDSGGSPVAPAELTWALILMGMRDLATEIERTRRGLWQGGLGRAVAGRRLGLIGFGRIAQRVARYAAAFEVPVTVWGRETTVARAREAGLQTAESLSGVCAESDIVSVHLRLIDATRGIVKFEHLAAMKPDALFVNTSRAELVEPGALERALKLGRPGRAAVDVFEDEPVFDPAHPLVALPNVVATPHIGFVERDTYERYFGDAFEAVNAFAAGKPVRVVE
ncbi:MAG: D-2-hydroxyacid dehydrogenase family protein [Burkholderiales bacterium]